MKTSTYTDLPQFPTSNEDRGTGSTSIKSFELLPAYPKPFNPTTQIGFSIPQQSRVKIGVYDQTGRQISTLFTVQDQPVRIRFPGRLRVSRLVFTWFAWKPADRFSHEKLPC